MELFIEYGYLGLFTASFLAATILPLSSEVVLSVLLLNGLSPSTLVGVATLGNVLGSVVNYGIGMTGGELFKRKFSTASPGKSTPPWPGLKNMAQPRCCLPGCRS